ncbi:MAG: hypothetical protein LBV23_00130 [Deltaproteobacteria bacterium]|jgi:hypothetical protein|nr:hypothetical protein [Deltaproteobacteria bacterium]
MSFKSSSAAPILFLSFIFMISVFMFSSEIVQARGEDNFSSNSKRNQLKNFNSSRRSPSLMLRRQGLPSSNTNNRLVSSAQRPADAFERPRHRRGGQEHSKGSFKVGYGPDGVNFAYNNGFLFGGDFRYRLFNRRGINYYSGWITGLDGKKIVYYDYLDRKDFPEVLNKIAYGLLGPVTWPNYQYYLGTVNSRALVKLFEHLKARLNAQIGAANDLPTVKRMELSVGLIREELEKVVANIAVMDGKYYYVKFKLSTGGVSPWSRLPLVFNGLFIESSLGAEKP